MTTNNSINANQTGIQKYDGAGTWTGITVTQNSLLVGGASNGINSLALTNAQLAIGSTGNAPVAATLTPGPGIVITNAPGSITIGSSGGGLSWAVVTGTTQTAVANTGYFANNAGTVVITLPTTCFLGDAFAVSGMNNATGWRLAVASGQTIHFGITTTTVSTGSIASTNTYDSILIVCNVASTSFIVQSSVGNLTVV